LATTPVYGWEYQTLADAPNGAVLGEDLALDVEATVSALASTVSALSSTVSAADTALDTRLDTIEAAWGTWVPTLTNLTLGSATQTARYRAVGKTGDLFWQFVLGAGSAVGTNPRFSLPFSVAAHYITFGITGGGELTDTAGGVFQARPLFIDATTMQINYWSGVGTQAGTSAAAPFAWGVGDALTVWLNSVELA
jgi:hypothetical protein